MLRSRRVECQRTDEEMAQLYRQINKIRREEGIPEDHHKVCILISELSNVPLRTVELVCDPLEEDDDTTGH